MIPVFSPFRIWLFFFQILLLLSALPRLLLLQFLSFFGVFNFFSFATFYDLGEAWHPVEFIRFLGTCVSHCNGKLLKIVLNQNQEVVICHESDADKLVFFTNSLIQSGIISVKKIFFSEFSIIGSSCSQIFVVHNF